MERSANLWQDHEYVSLGNQTLPLARREFLRLVFEAGHIGEWPKGVFGPNQVPGPVLKSVLLSSLALDICGTEEMLQASVNNPCIRYLAANQSLDWETLHDFRRRNLSLVLNALVRLFEELCRFSGAHCTREICRAEAETRVRRAVQADSMLLDL